MEGLPDEGRAREFLRQIRGQRARNESEGRAALAQLQRHLEGLAADDVDVLHAQLLKGCDQGPFQCVRPA